MTMISGLPRDLIEKILSRVPITCLGAVRSTCKPWNALSKTRILCKAEATDQFLGFMVKDNRVFSMRFNLHGILNEEFVDPSIKDIGGNLLNQVEISQVFHCDGLLLCVTRDNTRLVVWNPYLGQTRWIEPRNSFHRLDKYAIGYDKNKNHKILRALDDCEPSLDQEIVEAIGEFKIYDFNSNSWRILDVTPGWDIECYQRGASLRGNTYFFAKEKLVMEVGESAELEDILLCFDFTRETFGQFLPLPFPHYVEDIGTLFSVKQEKLAALYQRFDTYEMEVWVTTKIEPGEVSWSKFLVVDIIILLCGFC